MTAGQPDLVVRLARAEEYERVSRLTVDAYIRVPGIAEDEEYLDELGDVEGRAAVVPVLVAEDTAIGEILGAVAYIPGPGPLSETEKDGEAGFRMLAVDPAFQGRGAGRALVEACIARARADERDRLTLLTLPTMTSAHRLYESLGFRRAPDRDWEYLPGHVLWSFVLELG